MKCPSCSASADDGAAECPSCGLVFAKWRARQEKEKLQAAAVLAAMEAPASAAEPPLNPWAVRGAAAAFVVAWILMLGWYFGRHPAKRRPALGADTGQFVMMRDPKTGEMKRMPIQRMAGVPAPPAPATAEAPAAPPSAPEPSSDQLPRPPAVR